MEMRSLIVGFLVFALFVISFISFGVNMGLENNASHIITNDSTINLIYTSINDTIYTYQDDGIQDVANDSMTKITEEDPSLSGTLSSILLGSVTFLGASIMGIANSIFDVTLNPLLSALGIPLGIRGIIVAILSTIMLFTVTLLAWKLYRQGA